MTKNEILYSLNKPDDFILAILELLGDAEQLAEDPDGKTARTGTKLMRRMTGYGTRRLNGRSGARSLRHFAAARCDPSIGARRRNRRARGARLPHLYSSERLCAVDFCASCGSALAVVPVRQSQFAQY